MNKNFKNVVAVHTGDLLENKNKINEMDICTNTSNFGVQLKKEKFKSNAVGCRRPRRPERKI